MIEDNVLTAYKQSTAGLTDWNNYLEFNIQKSIVIL